MQAVCQLVAESVPLTSYQRKKIENKKSSRKTQRAIRAKNETTTTCNYCSNEDRTQSLIINAITRITAYFFVEHLFQQHAL